jgi:hypothetical protein
VDLLIQLVRKYDGNCAQTYDLGLRQYQYISESVLQLLISSMSRAQTTGSPANTPCSVDAVCFNFDTCSKILQRMLSFLEDKQEDIVYQIESQPDVVSVMVNVLPSLEVMVNNELIDVITEFGANAATPIKIYGDEEELNITYFLNLCHKYEKMKSMSEGLNKFDKMMLPVDHSHFLRKKRHEAIKKSAKK